MDIEDQTLVQGFDPAPVQDEYAPVIFAQETVSHIVSVDMMSGKVKIPLTLDLKEKKSVEAIFCFCRKTEKTSCERGR